MSIFVGASRLRCFLGSTSPACSFNEVTGSVDESLDRLVRLFDMFVADSDWVTCPPERDFPRRAPPGGWDLLKSVSIRPPLYSAISALLILNQSAVGDQLHFIYIPVVLSFIR